MTIKDNMEIQELHNYTQAQFEDMKQLMSELMEQRVEKECSHSLSRVATEEAKGQLSDRVNFTQTDLMLVLKDSNCHLYVILDGERIVGCATLCIFHSPTGTKASIEDVVVSSAYRGQHLGKQLMAYVLEQAKAYAPMDSTGSPTIELHLTSNPMRVAANKLYQSLGFQKKESNCYQMSIVDGTTVQDNQEKLKQSITYLIGKELAEGNQDGLTAERISRLLDADLNDVRIALKEING